MTLSWRCETCGYVIEVFQGRCPRCGASLLHPLANRCHRCPFEESCGLEVPKKSRHRPLLWDKKA